MSGGLGNQMFEYSFLLAMREATGEECLMDVTKLATYKRHNGFELDRVFDISARCASKNEIKIVSRYISNYKLSRLARKLLPRKKTEVVESPDGRYIENVFSKVTGDMYYEGIWQNHLYFDNIRPLLLKEFVFKKTLEGKNVKAQEFIKEKTTVSIHVRRGDYLNHRYYKGLCGLDYYSQAISYIKKKYGDEVRFVIFSNDIEWCYGNIQPLLDGHETLFVDWNKGAESYNDMRLMSLCNVNIIANSSFSWWAAYLNMSEDKEVIAPRDWINRHWEFTIQLPEWTLM